MLFLVVLQKPPCKCVDDIERGLALPCILQVLAGLLLSENSNALLCLSFTS